MNKFRNEKGVTLLALTITIVVMVIITATLITNTQNRLKLEKVDNLYSDIEQIKDKISQYYIKKGSLPIKEDAYCNAENLVSILKANGADKSMELNDLLDANDNKNTSEETYYVIDLSKLDNLTLNYGSEYKKWSSGTDLQDLYIINIKSHQIYYPKGILVDGKFYYSYNLAIKDDDTNTDETFQIEGISVDKANFENADSNKKIYIADKGKIPVNANLQVKVPSGTVLKNAYYALIHSSDTEEQEKPNSFTKCTLEKKEDALNTENDTYQINIISDKVSYGNYILWIRIEDQDGNEIITNKSTDDDTKNEIIIEEKKIELSLSEAKQINKDEGTVATRS